MLGWMHLVLKNLVEKKYGEDSWSQILTMAGFAESTAFEMSTNYSDEDTIRLATALGAIIGIPLDDVWEAYGSHLAAVAIDSGYGDIMRCLGSDMEAFLHNLDAFHYFITNVVYQIPKHRGPSFQVDANDDGSLTLHYYSRRSGLYPIVRGLVKFVAKTVFETEVDVVVQERKSEYLEDDSVTEHVVLLVAHKRGAKRTRSLSRLSIFADNDDFSGPLRVTLRHFARAFPYHVCFDEQLNMEHFGLSIKRVYPFCELRKTKLTEIMDLIYPDIPISFQNFKKYSSGIYVMQMKLFSDYEKQKAKPVRLKGSMTVLSGGKHILFVCSPLVYSIKELLEKNLHLNDFPICDVTRDLLMINQTRQSEVEMSKRLVETTAHLQKLTDEIAAEQEESTNLLSEMLPKSVVAQLQAGKCVEAGEYKSVTLMFSDIPKFHDICDACNPYEIVKLLGNVFSLYDRLVGLHDVYKVETIADSYVVAAGVPDIVDNHAERILNLALAMKLGSRSIMSPVSKKPILVRIGAHSGSIVAGIVGLRMPRYCLFGDTVNVSSRMESHSKEMGIHVSSATYNLAANCGFEFEERGVTQIKGKGEMLTYYLLKNNRISAWDLVGRTRGVDDSIDGYSELNDTSWITADTDAEAAASTSAAPTVKSEHTERKPLAMRISRKLSRDPSSQACVVS